MARSSIAIYPRDESGVSLIELMIYMALLVMISIVAGSLIISGMRGQREITNVGDATNQAQLISASVENGIRNASTFTITTTAGVGQRLVARSGVFTATGAVTWRCMAWLVVADGRFFTKVASTDAVAAPTSVTSATPTGWSLIASRVTVPTGTTTVFTQTGTSSKPGVLLAAQVGVVTGTGKPAFVQTQVTPLTLPPTTGTGPTKCS